MEVIPIICQADKYGYQVLNYTLHKHSAWNLQKFSKPDH